MGDRCSTSPSSKRPAGWYCRHGAASLCTLRLNVAPQEAGLPPVLLVIGATADAGNVSVAPLRWLVLVLLSRVEVIGAACG